MDRGPTAGPSDAGDLACGGILVTVPEATTGDGAWEGRISATAASRLGRDPPVNDEGVIMPSKNKQGRIGARTRVWDRSGLWGDYQIGDDCTIGRFVEIGDGVRIGNRCKIEAFAFIPPGVVIEDDVFIGPHACFTNDRRPRARGERERVGTVVRRGARHRGGAAAPIRMGVPP